MRALAFVLVAALAAPLAASAPDGPARILACRPPVVAGTLQTDACSVSGRVNATYQVRVWFHAGDVGGALVEAKGPGWTERHVVASAAVVPVALPPHQIGTPIPGNWTWTLTPAVAGDPPGVRMEVWIW